jgi:Domain of unknown function (DUF4188)
MCSGFDFRKILFQKGGLTMNDQNNQPPADGGYVAHLWDYPQLTIAIFGLQVHSPEAFALYEKAGIKEQMEESMAQAPGLLGVRFFMEGNGAMQFQYWRSHEDLAQFARTMPHTVWWKWLNENEGVGIGFYHEIYQCKTAEAIFEIGTLPVGPALFCQTSAVTGGSGRSQERQRRFIEARDESK